MTPTNGPRIRELDRNCSRIQRTMTKQFIQHSMLLLCQYELPKIRLSS